MELNKSMRWLKCTTEGSHETNLCPFKCISLTNISITNITITKKMFLLNLFFISILANYTVVFSSGEKTFTLEIKDTV